MDLPTLLAESDIADEVLEAALELIAVKAQTRELGTGTPPAILERFVTTQLDWADRFESMPAEKSEAESRAFADEFFRSQLR